MHANLHAAEAAHVRAVAVVPELELAAQLADQGALQPQQAVQPEEAEHAQQQPGHADVDPVHVGVAAGVGGVGVRAGYLDECANVGTFLKNLVFSLKMENEIMGAILNDGAEPKAAATAWLKANPDAITPWLSGVTTFDGGDAAAAVKSALGQRSL